MKHRHSLLRILLALMITGVGTVLAPRTPVTANGTPLTVTAEDDFRSGYDGGTGDWVGEWQEVEDATSAFAFWLDGDVYLDNTGHADAKDNHMVMKGGNVADVLYRQINLGNATAAALTFDYAPRGDLEEDGQYRDDVYVEVAATCAAGATWETVVHLVGATSAYTDTNPGIGPVTWYTATANLPTDKVGATTCLRYRVTGHLGDDEAFLLDDVSLSYTIDAAALSVGDFVWLDANGNGTQDSGEAGIAGVVLNLFRQAGTDEWVKVATTTTDANGGYVFTEENGLRFTATTYQIRIDATNHAAGNALHQKGHTLTEVGNATVDSDGTPLGDGGIGVEFSTGATTGWSKNSLDFGFTPGNAVCLPTIDFRTDAQGNYLFPGRPGMPAEAIGDQWADWGLTIATSNPGNTPIVIYDSSATFSNRDPDLNTPNGVAVTGGPGVGVGGEGEPGINDTFLGNMLIIQNNNVGLETPDDDADGGNMVFTFASPVTVTQIVYQDAEDSEDTTIETFASDGSPIGSPVHTRGYGNNSVDRLTIDRTEVAKITAAFAGSGAIPSIRFCGPTTEPKYELGDYVWYDKSEDGIQDDNETGIAGAKVELYTADNDNLVATTVTDQDGKYLFSDLSAGNYYLKFHTPAGYETASRKDMGGDDTKDSDAAQLGGETDTISLNSNDYTWDAGFYKGTTAVTLSGFSAASSHGQSLIAGLSIAVVSFAAVLQLKRRRRRAG